MPRKCLIIFGSIIIIFGSIIIIFGSIVFLFRSIIIILKSIIIILGSIAKIFETLDPKMRTLIWRLQAPRAYLENRDYKTIIREPFANDLAYMFDEWTVPLKQARNPGIIFECDLLKNLEPVYWNDFTLWDTATRYSWCGQKSYSMIVSRSSP